MKMLLPFSLRARRSGQILDGGIDRGASDGSLLLLHLAGGGRMWRDGGRHQWPVD